MFGSKEEVETGIYVMSAWIFNISFDRVVGQLNERTTERVVQLRNKNGEGWEINNYYMQMT